jgi:hypothetical protein
VLRTNLVSLRSEAGRRLTNTLFAHLDSDLPLYLWWQGEFPEPIDETLWAWSIALFTTANRGVIRASSFGSCASLSSGRNAASRFAT